MFYKVLGVASLLISMAIPFMTTNIDMSDATSIHGTIIDINDTAAMRDNYVTFTLEEYPNPFFLGEFRLSIIDRGELREIAKGAHSAIITVSQQEIAKLTEGKEGERIINIYDITVGGKHLLSAEKLSKKFAQEKLLSYFFIPIMIAMSIYLIRYSPKLTRKDTNVRY